MLFAALAFVSLVTPTVALVTPLARVVHAGRPMRIATPSGSRGCAMVKGGDGDDDGERRGIGERLGEQLDRAVFDPSADATSGEPGFLRNFRELFNEDQPMAEALYAGAVFAVLLCFAQQAVRLYKHCVFAPDRVCPWDTGGPSLDDVLNF